MLYQHAARQFHDTVGFLVAVGADRGNRKQPRTIPGENRIWDER